MRQRCHRPQPLGVTRVKPKRINASFLEGKKFHRKALGKKGSATANLRPKSEAFVLATALSFSSLHVGSNLGNGEESNYAKTSASILLRSLGITSWRDNCYHRQPMQLTMANDCLRIRYRRFSQQTDRPQCSVC